MSSDDFLDKLLSRKNDGPGAFEEEDVILAPLLHEIRHIIDESIRSFTRSVLLRAEHFWSAASSPDAKHSPPDEQKPGGGVLHTRRVVRMVQLLAGAQQRSQLEMDILVSAALLHDVTKYIPVEEGGTPSFDPLHPYTVDGFVELCRNEDAGLPFEGRSTTILCEEEVVQQILRLIRCQLGVWSPIPETIPVTNLDWMLHLADYLASKLDWLVDGDEPNPTRWS